MRIALADLATFAYCPAFYQFNRKDPVTLKPPTKKMAIIEDVVKRSYLRMTQDKRKPDWKMIMGWVDKAVFADIDVFQDAQYDLGRKQAENVLNLLKQWYDKILKNEDIVPGYADLEVTTQMNDFIFSGTVPLIKASEPPVIVVIGNQPATKIQLYNNIKYRALMWLICKELDTTEIQLDYYGFNESNGQFSKTSIGLGKKTLARTEEVVKQIAVSIKLGINYTSRTDECGRCPFYKECSF